MANRRFFLKSLLGSVVGYSFLSSAPLIGQGVSEIARVGTRSFMELLAEVYTRDAVFAPFERSLSPFVGGRRRVGLSSHPMDLYQSRVAAIDYETRSITIE